MSIEWLDSAAREGQRDVRPISWHPAIQLAVDLLAVTKIEIDERTETNSASRFALDGPALKTWEAWLRLLLLTASRAADGSLPSGAHDEATALLGDPAALWPRPTQRGDVRARLGSLRRVGDQALPVLSLSGEELATLRGAANSAGQPDGRTLVIAPVIYHRDIARGIPGAGVVLGVHSDPWRGFVDLVAAVRLAAAA